MGKKLNKIIWLALFISLLSMAPYFMQPSYQSKFVDYGTSGRIILSEAGTTVFQVTIEDKTFDVTVIGEGIEALQFSKEEKTILLQNNQTAGSLEIEIPKELLNGEFTVMIDDNVIKFTLFSTETHSTLLFERPTSSSIIEIQGTTVIPEFPFAMLALVAASTLTLFLIRTRTKYLKYK